MLFDDQAQTRRKLREAFTQGETLLLYGYSGVGKTTILRQFADKYSDYVVYFSDFSSLGATDLIAMLGESINLPLKKRLSEILTLVLFLRARGALKPESTLELRVRVRVR